MSYFVKLHKKILQWGWYEDINTTRVFIHCLLKANRFPGEWRGVRYAEGEFITSLETLSVETNLTVNQVRTAIKHLVSTGEITSKAQGKCRIITVNNWNEYQVSNKEDNSEVTRSSQGRHKVVTTDIDIKINKDKKNNRFVKPTKDEIKAYCDEKGFSVDPEKFYDYYESNGWLVGKNHMKDWQSTVRNWNRREKENRNEKKDNKFSKGMLTHGYDTKALEEELGWHT